MSDKFAMPADGNGIRKGGSDAVSDIPDGHGRAGVSGRTDAGEVGGGAYPNPHTGKSGGGLNHGGQSEMTYYGSGQAGRQGRSGPNAVAGSTAPRDTTEAPLPAPAADRRPHLVETGGRSFEVVEMSGVAGAEASGNLQSKVARAPAEDSKLSG